MASFWRCAHQGDAERLIELLDEGQDIDEYPPLGESAYRPTALAYAVWGNQPEAVELLLERGANPNLPDGDNNYYPLHWASYHNRPDCAELLVQAGADLTVRTQRGFTPLELAQGKNELVSSKPGVVAVLEEAAREPALPWTPHTSQPSSPRMNAQPLNAQPVAAETPEPERPRLATWPAGPDAAAAAGPSRFGQAEGRAELQVAGPRGGGNGDGAAGRARAESAVRAELAAGGRTVGVPAAAPRDAARRQRPTPRRGWALAAGALALLAAFAAGSAWPAEGPTGGAPLLVGAMCASAAAGLAFAVAPGLRGLVASRLARLGQAPMPSQFLCPITSEVMRDPVTTADGHAYERAAIERWLRMHDTSPMTGAPLEHKHLTPSIALRQLISEFCAG